MSLLVQAKEFDGARLQSLAEFALQEATQQQASAAEVGVSNSHGVSVTVRMGEVETVEHYSDQQVLITVYRDQCKGSASTSDLSPAAIRSAVQSACSIARFTASDDCAGLADPNRMATEIMDLDLYHPWERSTPELIELATACEDAARHYDERISNSEGATVDRYAGAHVYANSHGFIGGVARTRASISCAVIAGQQDSMQRDYWFSTARNPADLESVTAIGERAAQRAMARLNARQIKTCQVPVLYTPEMARSLLSHFVAAIRGSSLYRKASFLLDCKGQQIFPEFVHIDEQPHIPSGLGSAVFDSEGVATQARDYVTNGVLQDYVLNSYSARKLGLTTTGNAGGVRNLSIRPGGMDQIALLQEMQQGLLVTEMMGSGVNGVTGDYSRGASGFWVENGEIQYPVEEITVAGNLRDMFRQIRAVGNDVDIRSNIRSASLLIDGMTVAGN